MASDTAPTAATKKERIPGQSLLPLARVKRIIKDDPDVTLVNAEATHCIASATELFMEYLVNEGFSRAQKNKRKTIFYKDLASAVNQTDAFEFLEDVIPQTITLEEAYKRRQQADEGSTGTGKDDLANKRRKLQDQLNAQQSGQQEQSQQQQQEKESESQEQDDDGEDDEADEDEEEVDEDEEDEEQEVDEEDDDEDEEEE
ncbi:histone-fold-containing protein [Chlamydoabsidia padenii]|nr:histone-fold-containing protein [Chlamydoabsidia padenii]